MTDFEFAGAFSKDALAEQATIKRVAERIAVLHGLALPDSITGYSLVEAAERYIARAGGGGNADTDALADVVAWVEADATKALATAAPVAAPQLRIPDAPDAELAPGRNGLRTRG